MPSCPVSVEDWPYLDQDVLVTSHSLRVWMACQGFRHHAWATSDQLPSVGLGQMRADLINRATHAINAGTILELQIQAAEATSSFHSLSIPPKRLCRQRR